MKRKAPIKKEITLMTLLANEATADARKLLKKYKKADATDCADLEIKLAQLYFDTPDKIEIEKDLAEIHPHKNWLLKRTKAEEVKPEVVVDIQKTSSADAECSDPNCPVHGKCRSMSNADDIPTNPYYQTPEQKQTIANQNEANLTQQPYLMYVPVLGMVTIAAVVIYALSSIKNKS
jgi:hypothetical protein